MVQIVVTGIGLVSALGKNLQTSWKGLIAGHCGIEFHQPFPELPPRPIALIGCTPSDLTGLTNLVVAEALADAGLAAPLPECGVVVGSSRGCQAAWEKMLRQQFYPPHPSHQTDFKHWLQTLPHQAAITAAAQIGSQAAVLAPMAACATGIWAIAQGVELIKTGQCQRVIAGAVEAPITPLTLAGFNKMGALAQTGAYPFDRRREGLVLGEAGAILVMESLELAQQRGAKIYGQVLGFGLSADAYHVSAPDLAGKGALLAIKQCLERSDISSSEIGYIHAHGTATQLNDKNESLVIKYLFSDHVSVSSTKGATGHTLGASGALGAAFSLMALKEQILPPCVGLTDPEFDLNFVTASRQTNVERLLCLSFGFGGQNGAIAFSVL